MRRQKGNAGGGKWREWVEVNETGTSLSTVALIPDYFANCFSTDARGYTGVLDRSGPFPRGRRSGQIGNQRTRTYGNAQLEGGDWRRGNIRITATTAAWSDGFEMKKILSRAAYVIFLTSLSFLTPVLKYFRRNKNQQPNTRFTMLVNKMTVHFSSF